MTQHLVELQVPFSYKSIAGLIWNEDESWIYLINYYTVDPFIGSDCPEYRQGLNSSLEIKCQTICGCLSVYKMEKMPQR